MSAAGVDRLFRAFSDRTRLRILHLLKDQKEVCVGDLVAVLGLPQATVSRHLAYLRRSGLVSVREAGRWKHYSLAPARTPFHRELLACLASCFKEVRELARDRERYQHLRGCCPLSTGAFGPPSSARRGSRPTGRREHRASGPVPPAASGRSRALNADARPRRSKTAAPTVPGPPTRDTEPEKSPSQHRRRPWSGGRRPATRACRRRPAPIGPGLLRVYDRMR